MKTKSPGTERVAHEPESESMQKYSDEVKDRSFAFLQSFCKKHLFYPIA